MRVENALSEFFTSRPEVLEAYLFGSVARGEARSNSDIDLAVYLNQEFPKPPLGHQVELLAALMSVLKTDAIDLVILNQATPLLYHRVLRDGIRLSSKDLAATTTREAHAMSRYADDIFRMNLVRDTFPDRTPRTPTAGTKQ